MNRPPINEWLYALKQHPENGKWNMREALKIVCEYALFLEKNNKPHNPSLKADKLPECPDCAKWLNQNKYCLTRGRTKPLAP